MSRKEPIIPKGGIPDKPGYPNSKSPAEVGLDSEVVIKVFNEWNRRYSEHPEDFKDSLDKDGKPTSDYGECCAPYFINLYNELK